MASHACHDARTVEMMWTSDGDRHIPTPASCIPQVGRTILNPSRVSGSRIGQAVPRRLWLKAAEMINHLQGRRAVPRIPDPAQPKSPATHTAGDVRHLRRHCRNEYFIHTHIYARNGILTYAVSALLTIAVQPFQSFWQEIRSPITRQSINARPNGRVAPRSTIRCGRTTLMRSHLGFLRAGRKPLGSACSRRRFPRSAAASCAYSAWPESMANCKAVWARLASPC